MAKQPLVRALAETSALLCGGTAGIGFATAKALAGAGVPRLMLAGRSKAKGAAAADTLRSMYPDAKISHISADMTSAEGAMLAVSSAKEVFGCVDLLVNTAGLSAMPELFFKTPIEEIAPATNGLLHGTLLPSRAVLPLMMEQGGGCIINVASDAGKVLLISLPGLDLYLSLLRATSVALRY